jgi:hypothetical protein
MKTIIAGSRNIEDYRIVKEAIEESQVNITEVVSGCARGVDNLGEQWAKQNRIPIKKFPADWKKHNKAAGPIRNTEMAKYGEVLIAIWDGKSKGTHDMINKAIHEGLQVFIKMVEAK